MKTLLTSFLSSSAFILAGASSIVCAGDQHTIVPPQEIKWGPAPPGLPAGAEAVVLYGDPAKEGLFAMRLKVPDGYRVAP